ncbi:hypothetical protein, partial [Acidithiobacillus thiooxidans]|uniref:hypothetical protein n=1 Tax=Acidithiobacillus thiooxidans TaxID=930 RepID=UPI001F2F5EAB
NFAAQELFEWSMLQPYASGCDRLRAHVSSSFGGFRANLRISPFFFPTGRDVICKERHHLLI